MNTVRAEKIEQLGIIAKVIPRVYPKMTGVYDAGPAAGQCTKYCTAVSVKLE